MKRWSLVAMSVCLMATGGGCGHDGGREERAEVSRAAEADVARQAAYEGRNHEPSELTWVLPPAEVRPMDGSLSQRSSGLPVEHGRETQALTIVGAEASASEHAVHPGQAIAAEFAQGPANLAAVPPAFNTDAYDHIDENRFLAARENPLSTFSIDVDTASYSIVRRFLGRSQLPPRGAVRIEELVNYFAYDYPPPTGEVPFSVDVEVAGCPWEPAHRLVRIGLKGREIELDQRPPSNLVFLIDVSGSMNRPDRLPLVKSSLKLLVDQLTENDSVSMVVYAGASGLVLPATSGDEKQVILSSLEQLQAGGSTNGGQGIRLAYNTAVENFIDGGTNRVILCTDGDFNVGTTSQSELVRLVEEKARSGVFLTVLGYGMGNYKDSTMEKLADRGNGHYAYIDTINEARKVLVEQMTGTLITIAKDVKVQVDFNPSQVAGYRLLGYENRALRAEDFKDDAKDAGEIGAGHTVTALYQVVPAGREVPTADVEPSKYQAPGDLTESAASGELLTVRLRYKEPDGDVSRPLEVPVHDTETPFDEASADFHFAASVAAFGMLLRGSEHKGSASFENVLEIAAAGQGEDRGGYRTEFLELVRQARAMKK